MCERLRTNHTLSIGLHNIENIGMIIQFLSSLEKTVLKTGPDLGPSVVPARRFIIVRSAIPDL